MKNSLILYGVLCVTYFSSAQSDFVVLNSGDTIRGKVGFTVSDPYNSDKVQVKVNKEKYRYQPTEVRRVVKKNSHYVPVKINSKYQFAWAILEGYVGIYKYLNPESSGFEDFSKTVLVRKDGQMKEVSNLFGMKAIKDFLGDYDVLMTKIDEKDYTRGDVEEIVIFYNACIEAIGNIQETAISEESMSQNEKLNDLIVKVRNDELLGNNDALHEMLADVSYKVLNNKEVPAYLVEAIRSNITPRPDLLKDFDAILADTKK